MSPTQKEKQQAFRQKLQEEGADSFADGPRPWEQWDESGNQYDNRIWEGTARRIHPKRRGARGFGERLLSGLAVVALASMVVGIAGIYFSTPTTLSTPQQARTLIQPPPIVASKMTTPAATSPAESAETPAPVLARLDTLSPPAAGTRIVRDAPRTVLEPAVSAPWTDPVIPSGNLDKVAVETVITEEAVTTTVYTQQLSQDEPEVVAMVATTAPPFTHDAIQNDEPPVPTATETARPGQTEVPATAPAIIAQTGGEAITAPSVAGQTEYPASEPAVLEQAAAVATAPTVMAQAGIVVSEPAVVEQAAVVTTAPIVVAQAEIIESEPTVIVQAAAGATEPAVITEAGIVAPETAVVEQTATGATAPAVDAQAEMVESEPAVIEQAAAGATEPAVITEVEIVESEPAVVEETAKSATEAAVVVLNATEADAEATPDITRELETATELPVPPKVKTGKWVINLSSYTRKRTAERMLAVFKQKGVDAEVFTTTLNDKPMHRIRVTGFESARSARAEISALEQQLDLDGAWISKR